MSDTIKFTDQEMQSIVKLQNDYQQNIFALGQLDLEKTDLEHQLSQIKEQRDKIYDNWKNLQNLESQLLSSLSEKYGDGSLNIKDGTFKPTATR
jgi:hypothetical protein